MEPLIVLAVHCPFKGRLSFALVFTASQCVSIAFSVFPHTVVDTSQTFARPWLAGFARRCMTIPQSLARNSPSQGKESENRKATKKETGKPQILEIIETEIKNQQNQPEPPYCRIKQRLHLTHLIWTGLTNLPSGIRQLASPCGHHSRALIMCHFRSLPLQMGSAAAARLPMAD